MASDFRAPAPAKPAISSVFQTLTCRFQEQIPQSSGLINRRIEHFHDISEAAFPYLEKRRGLERAEVERMIRDGKLQISVDSVSGFGLLYFTDSSLHEPLSIVSLSSLLRAAGIWHSSTSQPLQKINKFLPVFFYSSGSKSFAFLPLDEPVMEKAVFFSSSIHITSVSDEGRFKGLLNLPESFDLESAIGEGLVRIEGEGADAKLVVFGVRAPNPAPLMRLKEAAERLKVSQPFITGHASELGLVVVRQQHYTTSSAYFFSAQLALVTQEKIRDVKQKDKLSAARQRAGQAAPKRAGAAAAPKGVPAKKDAMPESPEEQAGKAAAPTGVPAKKDAKPESPEEKAAKLHGALERVLCTVSPSEDFRARVMPAVIEICLMAEDPKKSADWLCLPEARKAFNRHVTLFEDIAWRTRVLELGVKKQGELELEGEKQVFIVIGYKALSAGAAGLERIGETKYFKFANMENSRLELLKPIGRKPLSMRKLVNGLADVRQKEFHKAALCNGFSPL